MSRRSNTALLVLILVILDFQPDGYGKSNNLLPFVLIVPKSKKSTERTLYFWSMLFFFSIFCLQYAITVN